MKDFLIILVGLYIFATSFFAAKYFTQPTPSQLVTPIKQLVLPNTKHQVILKTGEIIDAEELNDNAEHTTITDRSGLQTTFRKSNIDKIDDIPSEKPDNRLFVLGSITEKKLSHVEEILFFSDVMWIFWFLGIYWVCMRKKLPAWQGWAIASSFCISQSFLTTWLLGKQAGTILITAPNISTTLNHFFPHQNSIFFWGSQILVIGILPIILVFLLGKFAMRRKLLKLREKDLF